MVQKSSVDALLELVRDFWVGSHTWKVFILVYSSLLLTQYVGNRVQPTQVSPSPYSCSNMGGMLSLLHCCVRVLLGLYSWPRLLVQRVSYREVKSTRLHILCALSSFQANSRRNVSGVCAFNTLTRLTRMMDVLLWNIHLEHYYCRNVRKYFRKYTYTYCT